jgi:hypothetical protein
MSAETGCEPIPEPYVMQGILHRELIKAINERDEARECLRDAIQVLEQIPAAAWPNPCIEHKDNLLKRLSSSIEDLP